jgi:hypothetical protein
MARAHRIGQKAKVTIFRLVTKNTYEMDLFNRSSMKLGLDHAVLQSYTARTEGEAPLKSDEIETMLRKGAYHVFLENSDTHQLNEDDIDVIMKRDARVVTYDADAARTEEEKKANGGGSNNFSKASFVLNGEAIDLHSNDFWDRVGLKEPEPEAPLQRQRRRKKVDYHAEGIIEDLSAFNGRGKKRRKGLEDYSGGDDSDEESDSSDFEAGEGSSSSSGDSDEDDAMSDDDPEVVMRSHKKNL